MALQPCVGPWTLFQFFNPIHGPQDSLDRGSARLKASTYTQDNTNRIRAVHALDRAAVVIDSEYIPHLKSKLQTIYLM
jgi:hypothetical protein